MAINLHILWLWALLILTETLSLSIEEPLPRVGEVCPKVKNKDKPSKPYSETEIIENLLDEQIFTGSGTYIANKGLDSSGIVTSVFYCGFLCDDKGACDPCPEPASYNFTLLHLKLSGGAYDIVDQEVVTYTVADGKGANCDRKNLTCESHNISGWEAVEGDQFGIAMPAQCDMNCICPIRIGLINASCEDTSLFVNQSTESPNSYQKRNTLHVAIKLNFKVEIDTHLSEPTEMPSEPVQNLNQSPPYLPIIYVISVLFFVVVVVLLALSTVLIVRLKHTKPHIYNGIKREIRRGSARLQNTIRRRNESRNDSGVNNGFENRSYSGENEYSTNYISALDTNDSTQQGGNNGLFNCHQASLLTGSYEEPIDAINHYEWHDTEEDLYTDPPGKEMDLKTQLQRLEVPKENLQMKEYLGSGQFGIVYRGLLTVTGVDSGGGVKEVAMKTMENGASEEQRIKFLQEAAIMRQFNNPYIIKIFGVVTCNQPYMIICELMNKGDLRCYLHTLKISYSQEADEIGVMLLKFSREVASAMKYLSCKGFVHRDLAARNILVSMDRICKVSDFGLSRDLQDEDYYVAHGGLIPIRWTAPEALKKHKYSTASDVWSYGIVVFEIWSLASRPYGTLTNEQVLRKLFVGYRLSCPSGCPRAVYNLMISCWHPDADQRPTFTQLHASLEQPDHVLLEWSEDDRANYSENARTIGTTFQDGEVLHSTLQKAYLASETI